MDVIRENAKMFAGAVATLLVLATKPFWPIVADPAFQPALEIVIGMIIVAGAVFLTKNRPTKVDALARVIEDSGAPKDAVTVVESVPAKVVVETRKDPNA